MNDDGMVRTRIRRGTAQGLGRQPPTPSPHAPRAEELPAISVTALRAAAPRICAFAGRPYDPVLLADGLPAGAGDDPEGGGSPLLADWIARWLAGHRDRRRQGLYLTPRGAARSLLQVVVGLGPPPETILDPAVGAGVFLEEAIALFGERAQVWGIDCDPIAVALSRLAVWIHDPRADPGDLARRIRLADALRDPDPFGGAAPREGFGLICGNPPFGNAIEKRTARGESERRALRSRFPETASGPYDRSLLFVDLAARLLSPRGRYALLLPRALMAARYATRLRAMLERAAPIERIVRFDRDAPVPECQIFMVGWIGARAGGDPAASTRAAARPARAERDSVSAARKVTSIHVPRGSLKAESWGTLLDPDGARIERTAAPHPRLGDYFDVRASASVAEAYAILGAIREARETDARGDGWRFLTVRLITRHHHRWGSRSSRVLGRFLRAPLLPRTAPGLSPARARLYDRPKIIVAGLSRAVKAICDGDGGFAGSVGTICAVPRGADGIDARRLLRRATLLLNSGWISAVHRLRRGPLALSGGSIPLGKADLADLPLPRPIVEEGPAIVDDASLLRFLEDAERPLPLDPGLLLGILDAGAEVLLDRDAAEGDASERWDLLVQRAVDRIAGFE